MVLKKETSSEVKQRALETSRLREKTPRALGMYRVYINNPETLQNSLMKSAEMFFFWQKRGLITTNPPNFPVLPISVKVLH